MKREQPLNPWAKRKKIIDNIQANADTEAIDVFSKALGGASKGKRKLKGIYFDADIAEALDQLKAQRVNVSGFVNSVVRKALQKE